MAKVMKVNYKAEPGGAVNSLNNYDYWNNPCDEAVFTEQYGTLPQWSHLKTRLARQQTGLNTENERANIWTMTTHLEREESKKKKQNQKKIKQDKNAEKWGRIRRDIAYPA